MRCHGAHTLGSPDEAAVLVAKAVVEVDVCVDVLAILSAGTGSQDVALVDADGVVLAGVQEVRHGEG